MCPHCTCARGWRAPDCRWRCAGCDRRVSATSDTIFHHTRTPLTVWFAAAWLLSSSKIGVSATHLHREMQFGSFQTAWAILHRYRSVIVRPGRDRLRGDVEVDESFLGGPQPGVPGRGALDKVLFAAAVERDGHRGLGRARLGVIPDASAASLRAFLLDNIEPGDRHQRWLEGIPRRRERALHTPCDIGVRLRQARARGTARSPPSDLARQALTDGHHAGLGQPRAPPSVLRRVGVPIQPPTLTTPRTAVLPPHLPSRRQRPGHLRRPAQVGSHQTSTDHAPIRTRPAIEPPSWPRRLAMAKHVNTPLTHGA